MNEIALYIISLNIRPQLSATVVGQTFVIAELISAATKTVCEIETAHAFKHINITFADREDNQNKPRRSAFACTRFTLAFASLADIWLHVWNVGYMSGYWNIYISKSTVAVTRPRLPFFQNTSTARMPTCRCHAKRRLLAETRKFALPMMLRKYR